MRFAWLVFAVALPAQTPVSPKLSALSAEMRRGMPLLDHPPAAAYASGIGVRIGIPSVEIVSGDAIEPLALPDGSILIPAKFFSVAQDEAEFAAVLAHVAAHVRLKHGFRSPEQAKDVSLAAIPLVYLGGAMSCHAHCGGSRPLVPMAFLDEARAQELEADRLGLHIAAQAGYPPSAYRRYVARHQAADSALAPLPPRQVRLAALDAALPSLPDVRYVPGPEFAAIAEQISPPVRRAPPSLRR